MDNDVATFYSGTIVKVMDFETLLTAKPVLIGMHLGFAVLGIDALLWVLGEQLANIESTSRKTKAAIIALVSFAASWLIGGYYYVSYYGPHVKPLIKAGAAPWAHTVAMEAKEHVFLFLIPLSITAILLARLDGMTLSRLQLKRASSWMLFVGASLGLFIGLLGYIISAAARWAV